MSPSDELETVCWAQGCTLPELTVCFPWLTGASTVVEPSQASILRLWPCTPQNELAIDVDNDVTLRVAVTCTIVHVNRLPGRDPAVCTPCTWPGIFAQGSAWLRVPCALNVTPAFTRASAMRMAVCYDGRCFPLGPNKSPGLSPCPCRHAHVAMCCRTLHLAARCSPCLPTE